MKRMRSLAVPGLILLSGTVLAACGDTEPASTSSEDSIMEESMMSESPSPDAMMSDDDSMMEDEG